MQMFHQVHQGDIQRRLNRAGKDVILSCVIRPTLVVGKLQRHIVFERELTTGYFKKIGSRNVRLSVRRKTHDLAGIHWPAEDLLSNRRKHSTQTAKCRHAWVALIQPCAALSHMFFKWHY